MELQSLYLDSMVFYFLSFLVSTAELTLIFSYCPFPSESSRYCRHYNQPLPLYYMGGDYTSGRGQFIKMATSHDQSTEQIEEPTSPQVEKSKE